MVACDWLKKFMNAEEKSKLTYAVNTESLQHGHQREQLARRLNRLAYWLDDRFRVPGTQWRLGLDGLIGLIPGVGDLTTSTLGLYVIYEAYRQKLPSAILARMLWHLATDATLGSIPVLGDFFDFRYKANRKNVDLLLSHLN